MHAAVRDALDEGALDLSSPPASAFDCDGNENWRVLVFKPDGAGAKLVGHVFDEDPSPGLPGVAIAQREATPATLGPLLAGPQPVGRQADLIAVADAEVAVGPADLTRVYRAARALAQVREHQPWANEVLVHARGSRPRPLGAWVQTLSLRDRHARALRSQFDERELAEEFDRGKRR